MFDVLHSPQMYRGSYLRSYTFTGDTAVRVWDVEPALLCRQHLLGEHRELHGLWNILVLGHRGYSMHPETRRWEGKLAALFIRHEQLVTEMYQRGYRHASPLDAALATGSDVQDVLITPIAEQLELLRTKPCQCMAVGTEQLSLSRAP